MADDADDRRMRRDMMIAPYEARPITLTLDEIRQRHLDGRLGRELARIAGATEDPLRQRLRDLWYTGRVTQREYLDLAAALARAGLLSD